MNQSYKIVKYMMDKTVNNAIMVITFHRIIVVNMELFTMEIFVKVLK